MKNLAFCLGFLLLAISCNNSHVTSSSSGVMKDFEVLHLSEYGGSGEEKILTLTDQKEFEEFWNKSQHLHSESKTVPQIDFSKKMVVIKHFPSRNSGGTTYDIVSVEQSGNNTNIYYTTSSSEIATMAITSPLMIVVVNKTNSPVVEFKVKN